MNVWSRIVIPTNGTTPLVSIPYLLFWIALLKLRRVSLYIAEFIAIPGSINSVNNMPLLSQKTACTVCVVFVNRLKDLRNMLKGNSYKKNVCFIYKNETFKSINLYIVNLVKIQHRRINAIKSWTWSCNTQKWKWFWTGKT